MTDSSKPYNRVWLNSSSTTDSKGQKKELSTTAKGSYNVFSKLYKSTMYVGASLFGFALLGSARLNFAKLDYLECYYSMLN